MMETTEQLYYSPAAIDRFEQQEAAIRERQLSKVPFGAFDAELAHLRFTQSAGAQAALESPLFGAWLDRISRTAFDETITNEKERGLRLQALVGFMGNYAVTAALMANEERRHYVRASYAGDVVVPEYGRLLIPGIAPRTWVDVETTEQGTTFGLPRRVTVHIPRDELSEPTPQWEPLRYVGPDGFRIPLHDFDPNRDMYRFAPADRLSEEDYDRWHIAFCDAWDYLQNEDSEAAALVRASLKGIVPLPEESLLLGKGTSSGAAFGVIGTNQIQDPQRLATHLVFGTIKHLFIALRNERPGIHPEHSAIAAQKVYPPSYEGVGLAMQHQDDFFLNTGLAHFFEGLTHSKDPAIRAYGELSFARRFTEARQNFVALGQTGYGRETDQEVLEIVEQELVRLETPFSALPDHIQETIAVDTQDRRISWRLHSAIPDTAAVDFLRHAWQQGEPCPWISVPVRASDQNDIYTHIGQRTRYLLAETRYKEPDLFRSVVDGVARPDIFGDPTPGDIAFARGDMQVARHHFKTAIKQNMHDPEVWAGFALTYHVEPGADMEALLACPEIVAAVYAAINDPETEPEAVTAWLAAIRPEADFSGGTY